MRISAFLATFDFLTSFAAMYTASKRAVIPFERVIMIWYSMSEACFVSGTASFGALSNTTRKNSSSSFATLKNSWAASWYCRSIPPMLPLTSNTNPTATGSSSIVKRVMTCSTLLSKTRKFPCSNPVTGRPDLSVTVTGTATRSVVIRRVGVGSVSIRFVTAAFPRGETSCPCNAGRISKPTPATSPAIRFMLTPCTSPHHPPSDGRAAENQDGVLVPRKLLRLLTAFALGVGYFGSGVAAGHFGGMAGYAFAIFVLAPGIYILRLFPAPGRACGTDCLLIVTGLSALVDTAVLYFILLVESSGEHT